MHVRNSAKALIVLNGKILTIKYQDKLDEWFILPGGGQEHGETLDQALRRECLEEASVRVEVKEMLWIREYIGKNHNSSARHRLHQVEFLFLCTIISGQPGSGHTPDTDQVGVEWLDLHEIETKNFFPRDLRPRLIALLNSEALPGHPVYLGDIN